MSREHLSDTILARLDSANISASSRLVVEPKEGIAGFDFKVAVSRGCLETLGPYFGGEMRRRFK